MKKATCRQLKGVCDAVITGETPEQMAQNAKDHAMDKFADGDKAHIEAGQKMMAMPKEEQQKWYQKFVDEFDQLEDV